jgi:hypothetical protein
MEYKISLKNPGIIVFAIMAGIILIASCEKYSFRVETVDPVDSVHFSTVIQPLLDDKCTACHRGSRDPDLRSANSYESLTTGGYVNLPADKSKLYTQVISSSHASFTLPEEKLRILYWISQGAKNNK